MLAPSQTKRLLITLGVLLPIAAVAHLLAYWMRFPEGVPASAEAVLAATVGWALAVKMGAMVWFRLHQGWSRCVAFHDLTMMVQAVACGAVGITVVDTFLLPQLTIPRSIVLLDAGTTLCLLAAARSLPRLLREVVWLKPARKGAVPALIVGAGESGEALLRAIRHNTALNYEPVGFVDDQPDLQRRRIGGVPVLGTYEDIPALVDQRQVEEVLITADELPGKQVRELVHVAQRHGFRVKVLPSYEQLLEGKVAVQPRAVAIGDLLRRPSVELKIDDVRQWTDGRTLLVTGSAGSIGSEICRQLVKLSNIKIVLLDRSETGQFFLERELRRLAPEATIEVALGDTTDQQRMHALFETYRPDIIFHASAYKHVPLMETHVGEAVKNITLATRNLADLADEFNAEAFVMISTDKAVNPTSVMGACKRLAEQYVQAKAESSKCRFVTVRFGNVLDSAGSVVPIFREQIAQGGPVTVTHPEMIRYFMMIPEAAQLVIQAGAMGQGGEIFVLDMGKPVRILDLAQDMIRLSGLRVGEDIEIEVTGLRPGEKLYEELYGSSETHQQTSHSKIMVATGEPRRLLEVMYDLGRLKEIANAPSDMVRRVLTEIIPTQPSATETEAPEFEHRAA